MSYFKHLMTGVVWAKGVLLTSSQFYWSIQQKHTTSQNNWLNWSVSRICHLYACHGNQYFLWSREFNFAFLYCSFVTCKAFYIVEHCYNSSSRWKDRIRWGRFIRNWDLATWQVHVPLVDPTIGQRQQTLIQTFDPAAVFNQTPTYMESRPCAGLSCCFDSQWVMND